MVAALTTLQCLWTCMPPTYMYTNTVTHLPVCVSDATPQGWGEGVNLHLASSVLQVTAWHSAALSLSSAGVPATASALIFNQTRTGRNWSQVCCFYWSRCQAVEFLEIQKRSKTAKIGTHYNTFLLVNDINEKTGLVMYWLRINALEPFHGVFFVQFFSPCIFCHFRQEIFSYDSLQKQNNW